MTTDLTERLRRPYEQRGIRKEAADELDRLRAALEWYHENFPMDEEGDVFNGLHYMIVPEQIRPTLEALSDAD